MEEVAAYANACALQTPTKVLSNSLLDCHCCDLPQMKLSVSYQHKNGSLTCKIHAGNEVRFFFF